MRVLDRLRSAKLHAQRAVQSKKGSSLLSAGDAVAPLALGDIRLVVPAAETSTLSKRIISTGYTEAEFTDATWSALNPGSVVADVGASMGYYTCLFGRRVGSNGHVIAFEPWGSVLPYLNKNLSINDVRNVTMDHHALMDETGSGTMGPPNYRVTIDGPMDEGFVQVEAARFDDLPVTKKLKQLDAIKIDIEGAELRALEGMRSSIERWKPLLFLEVHPQYLPHYDDSVEGVHSFLDGIGYDRVMIGRSSDPSAHGHHVIAGTRERLESAHVLPSGERTVLFDNEGKASDWHMRPGGGVKAEDASEGVTFSVDLEPEKVEYALSHSWAIRQPPPGARMEGGRCTRLTWRGRARDGAQASVWLIEYDGDGQVRTRSFPIDDATGVHAFVNSPRARSFRVGVRMMGSGTVDLNALVLEQWHGN
jgi:FkbM family methyltransferase